MYCTAYARKTTMLVHFMTQYLFRFIHSLFKIQFSASYCVRHSLFNHWKKVKYEHERTFNKHDAVSDEVKKNKDNVRVHFSFISKIRVPHLFFTATHCSFFYIKCLKENLDSMIWINSMTRIIIGTD